jgi:hypothetical protein
MLKRRITILLLLVILMGLASAMLFQRNAKAITEDDQILVWNAPAVAPGQQAANQVGILAYINNTGALQPITDVLAQSSKVEACGPNALSPDGRRYAMFMGVDQGRVAQLYLMTDGDVPVLVDDTFSSLGCTGTNGLLQYSPDNSKIAYIDYEIRANVDFADGYLRVRAIDEGFTEQFSERGVVAFDFMDNERVAFVQFFTNEFNEANEVAVIVWDGSNDRELTSFIAEEGCRYQGAHTNYGSDNRLWMTLLETCNGTRTMEMLRINPDEDGAIESLFSVEATGNFGPASQTNNIIFAPNGDTVYYTVPDGVRINTVSLWAYDPEAATSTQIIERLVEMPTLGGSQQATSKISKDGRWFVAVLPSPNNQNNTIQIVDLNDPATPPVVLSAGSAEDQISYMGISENSETMVYVAGGVDGRDNSLFRYSLGSGATEGERAERGVYAPWAVISPGGTEVVILEYQIQEEGIAGPDYLNLVNIDMDNSGVTTLFQGGVVENNEVENIQFAMPLRWFRSE